MDLMLFPNYLVPSRFTHAAREAPVISAEAFATWPEHMRREFALLAAEAGVMPARVRKATGISEEALIRARESRGLYARSFSDAKAGVDDDVGNAADRASRRAGWRRRRLSDA